MKAKNLLILFISAVLLAIALQENASATSFGAITYIEVNGIAVRDDSINLGSFVGDRLPILVRFDATANAEDVRVLAWISGERRKGVETERFDVYENVTYTKFLLLDLPSSLSDLSETRTITIEVESQKTGTADRKTVRLVAQRRSYSIEILEVEMPTEVRSGENLFIDVVVKNRGSRFAEDNFLIVSIPEIGVNSKAYLGDLSAIDRSDPDKEDTVEKRVFVRIPKNVQSGLYSVKIKAFNGDSVAETEKRVFISGAEKETIVILSKTSRTLRVSEEAEYTISIVNKGRDVAVYTIRVDEPDGLDIKLEESTVAVPSGLSKSVTIKARAKKEGNYNFNVAIIAEDGSIVSNNNLKAEVKKSELKEQTGATTNATVLLTIVLAIIFVVLLVVLIVLLTRKPEKTEDYRESYY